jgi:hypothetical protein
VQLSFLTLSSLSILARACVLRPSPTVPRGAGLVQSSDSASTTFTATVRMITIQQASEPSLLAVPHR